MYIVYRNDRKFNKIYKSFFFGMFISLKKKASMTP